MTLASRAFTLLRLRMLRRGLKILDERRRRLLAWRALEGLAVRSITFERDGIVWSTALENMGFHLFVENGFQAAEISALQGWMDRQSLLSGSRSVFVDVGANIGSTCIPVVVETGCRAVAIEPVEANFRLLLRNIEANGLRGRVLPVKKAVLRLPAKVRMAMLHHDSGGHHVCRDDVDVPRPQGDLEDVEADGLLAILDSVGVGREEVALVWADVQGCEAEVIASGAALWEAAVPLWAEIEPHSLQLQGSLATFAQLAAAHFDRFIASRDLLDSGSDAPVRPIAELADLIRGITPCQQNTDVLFLPPRFRTRPGGGGSGV